MLWSTVHGKYPVATYKMHEYSVACADFMHIARAVCFIPRSYVDRDNSRAFLGNWAVFLQVRTPSIYNLAAPLLLFVVVILINTATTG